MPVGELKMEDFGRESDIKPGDGDIVSRLNGLLRCLGPLEADVDMISLAFKQMRREIYARVESWQSSRFIVKQCKSSTT